MSLRNNSLAECIRDVTPASANAPGADDVGSAVLEALQEIDTARRAAGASAAQIAAAQTIQSHGLPALLTNRMAGTAAPAIGSISIRLAGTAAPAISGISEVLTGRPANGRAR